MVAEFERNMSYREATYLLHMLFLEQQRIFDLMVLRDQRVEVKRQFSKVAFAERCLE